MHFMKRVGARINDWRLPGLREKTNLMNQRLGTLAHRANRTTNPGERERIIKEMDKRLPKRNAAMRKIEELNKKR